MISVRTRRLVATFDIEFGDDVRWIRSPADPLLAGDRFCFGRDGL